LKACYFCSDVRGPLTVVSDEMSVGQSVDGTLFNHATLQVDMGSIDVNAIQLGANTWRLRLQEDSWRVEWAEPDSIQDWQRAATPNDPLFPDQWHLQNTGQGGGIRVSQGVGEETCERNTIKTEFRRF